MTDLYFQNNILELLNIGHIDLDTAMLGSNQHLLLKDIPVTRE